LKINLEDQQGKISVDVEGDIDDFTYSLLVNEIDNLMLVGSKKIAINLEKCHYISFSCIKYLVDKKKNLSKNGAFLDVVMNDGEEKELFDLMVTYNESIL
tara:strand:- start:267 stop:566 length:300 start_codon:yes stop_codon:yes gene_type:complete